MHLIFDMDYEGKSPVCCSAVHTIFSMVKAQDFSEEGYS